MQVFTIAFEELRKIVLYQVNYSRQSDIPFKIEDVCWVITIPATRTDEARQFMREAVTNAGMRKHRFVLEPEAAALFALNGRFSLANDFTTGRFEPGSKYILANIGGGTVEMCVHEILGEGCLRELHHAIGGQTGGLTVNEAFLGLLKNILVAKTVDTFRKDFPHAFHDLESQIEEKKCAFSRNSEAIVLRLDKDFISISKGKRWKKESVDDLISKSPYANEVSFRKQGNILKLERSVVQKILDISVDAMILCLKAILKECADESITSLLLVGGYSKSDYVKDRIQTSFPNMIIIQLENTQHPVIKGAVVMATRPLDAIERRARFTYGYSCDPPFVDGQDPEELKFYQEGETACKGVFEKLIEVDQVVKYGQHFSRKFCKTTKQENKHKTKYFVLWRSPLKNPKYCLMPAEKCECVGKVKVAPPKAGWPNVVNGEQSLVVKETEFIMTLSIRGIGEVHKTAIDFL